MSTLSLLSGSDAGTFSTNDTVFNNSFGVQLDVPLRSQFITKGGLDVEAELLRLSAACEGGGGGGGGSGGSSTPPPTPAPFTGTPASCSDWKSKQPISSDGAFTLTTSSRTFNAYCDMSTMGGGWTMIASYKSGFYHGSPKFFETQVTGSGGAQSVPSGFHPDFNSFGHLPYNWFSPQGKEVAISCQGSNGNHFYADHTLFSNWGSGDKGSYGAHGSPGWANFYAGDTGGSAGARGSHYGCGTAPHTGHLSGVSYCSGPGGSGSWENHLASYTSYSSGAAIGCAGGSGSALQVWIRDYHPTFVTQKSCADHKKENPNASDGTFWIDFDGPSGAYPPFEIYCDMTTNGGGWNMIASYKSGFYHSSPRFFEKQGHGSGGSDQTSFTRPSMTDYGNLPYNYFTPGNKEVAISCQGSNGNHFYADHTLFSNWGSGDKGSYGAHGSPGWANFYAGDTGGSAGARGSHYGCGTAPTTGHLSGVSYCSGPGGSGSWGNHLASYTSYSSGAAIGCAGGSGSALQVWIRDYHPETVTKKSCQEHIDAVANAPTGVYWIDVDGPSGLIPPTQIFCDMTTNGGGWSMLASYKSGFYHSSPRFLEKQGHGSGGSDQTSFTYPTMSDYGNLPYNYFTPFTKDVAISCQGSNGNHFYSSNSLFLNWGSGDKGSYGAHGSPGWANFYAGDTGGSAGARGSHYGCGTAPTTGHLSGVSYCSGPGGSGSWGNHLASYTSYSSGAAIGCAGGSGSALQVWVR